MPGMSKAHPPGIEVINLSAGSHVRPPSKDLLKTSPCGPAQATYTLPFGPTAGTAPSTVLSSSTQSPPLRSIRNEVLQFRPPSTEREKNICELSNGFVLPYLSNCVQVV